MLNDDDMLQGFLEEAAEHLSTIEPDLLSLEEDPSDIDILNRLFRSVHSIKGGAGFFGMETLGALAHVMENLMSKARTGKILFNKAHIDALFLGLDRLNGMLADIESSNAMDISEEKQLIESLTAGEAAPAAAPVAPPVSEPVAATVAAPVQPQQPAVEAPAVVEGGYHTMQVTCHFNVEEEEIESLAATGMHFYAVSVLLNRDIMAMGKTPFQFITELEELGRFIDSYLDVDGAEPLGGEEEDLPFTFLFASVMDPEVATEGLGLRIDQLTVVTTEQLLQGQVVVNAQMPEKAAPAQIPVPVEAVAVAAPAAVPVAAPVIPAIVSGEPPAPPAMSPPPPEIPAGGAKANVKKVKSEESIRVSVGKLNKLVDMAGELVLVRNQLLQSGESNEHNVSGLSGMLQGLNMVTTELQEEILNTRMQAVSSVFGRFPRIIRELGSQLGKEINLNMEGGEVELDKTVLEALGDPLTHIIRNTADHGIESPADRTAAGKPEAGTLLLKAYHESGQVIILVRDDGRGIDPERVLAKAYEKGLVKREDYHNLSEREKINLIFLPGFSTAEQVSSVSGRGVGMDVVRSNIEAIGGSVELNSTYGKGTTIKMTLPLTMAIVSCLIVASEKQHFAIPQVNLDELVMLKPDDYRSMLGYVQDKEVLKLRGDLLPLISLAQGFGIKPSIEPPYKKVLREIAGAAGSSTNSGLAGYQLSEKTKDSQDQEAVRILIVSIGINKVGIIVDSIVGSEEIVVKPMPEYLQNLTQFSGATILGNGTVAMIIDTLGFVQKNKLFFHDHQSEITIREVEERHETELQSLLVFDNDTEEQFAMTIPLIQRVDEIDMKDVQRVGDKKYLEYRGTQMRVINLSDYLPIQRPESEPEVASIIIPKETRIPVGILIHKVIDTRTMEIDVTEGTIHSEGILGSTLIDGQITLLLDLFAIMEMAEPANLNIAKFEPKVIEESKILLVEDTPLFLTIVREYLTSVGFDVVTAENGQEGLDKLKEEKFDLVLSDIEMPVMDGFGLIKEIRSQSKYDDLPVIALTSLNDDETVTQGRKAGFNDWLIKLDKEQILNSINSYLKS